MAQMSPSHLLPQNRPLPVRSDVTGRQLTSPAVAVSLLRAGRGDGGEGAFGQESGDGGSRFCSVPAAQEINIPLPSLCGFRENSV